MTKSNTQPEEFAPAIHRLAFVFVLAVVAWAMTAGRVAAQTGPVMRVEEDWELRLDQPASIKTAPQLETVISPFASAENLFARTTWNYREFPDFVPGGMQLQAWQGSQILAQTNFGSNDLSTVSETVTWTQQVSTDGTLLVFKIKDGQSTTWGNFGGSTLTLLGVVNLDNLDSYSTDVSVENSGISFGANRVQLLQINEVRRYGPGDVLLETDSSPKLVYPTE